VRFFIVTPLIVLLLLIVNRGMSGGAAVLTEGLYTPEMIAGLLGISGVMILTRVRSDHSLISTVCRIFLPVFALILFAITPFIPDDIRMVVTQIGIDTFCTVYSLLLSAILLATASRMRSLLVPFATAILVALGLIALLTFRGTEADFLGDWRPRVCVALFSCTVILLLYTPGSQIWRRLFENSADEGRASAPSLQQRCAALGKACNLTEREAEILPLLGRGYSASYVADMLVVAESTIRTHRQNIYRKLDINSREELFDMLDDLTIDFCSERAAETARR
jgi:DNA-binding CsgD family transcriptional regulator